MKVLCFDIGGTAIKYTIIENDVCSKINKIPTRKDNNTNYILKDILNIIQDYLKYESIDAIGISTAGVVDNKKGEIIFAGPTIPNYTGEKIKETIEKMFNIKCVVENDVNSAAYGEYTYFKYSGTTFCMTIGTGVGGAIIINDDIYRGKSKMAGEIGYMPLKDTQYQTISSATFLATTASKRLGYTVNGEEIFNLAKKGNQICNEVINEMIDNLVNGILNIIYILNPENIIIGGGITAQGEYLEKLITNKVKEKIIDEKFNTNIKLAKLANSAGLYGIYYLTKNNN